MKFKKSTVGLAWSDGTRRDMDCVEMGGLTIHKDPGNFYVVSHAASGRAVQKFLKAKEARAFILAALSLHDWTLDEAATQRWLSTEGSVEAVVDLGRQHGAIR